MFFKIVCFAIALNVVLSDSVQDELKNIYDSREDLFAELPCLSIGGYCEKVGQCPKKSHEVPKGLCPVQQKDGVECCKPQRPMVRCRQRGGDCVSTSEFTCPDFLIVKEAFDCKQDEVCCVFV
ncbi:uncharacterized protein LOC142977981 isoform X2 [Anticarsia gemmatalis]|uniref:uncharacterized protein LOC142977981 isoform X2 n=1 Tax=Anticarsia gemmatalis TaxID=129554 RepID=UPI003F776920